MDRSLITKFYIKTKKFVFQNYVLTKCSLCNLTFLVLKEENNCSKNSWKCWGWSKKCLRNVWMAPKVMIGCHYFLVILSILVYPAFSPMNWWLQPRIKGQAHDMFSRIFQIWIYEFFQPNVLKYLFWFCQMLKTEIKTSFLANKKLLYFFNWEMLVENL